MDEYQGEHGVVHIRPDLVWPVGCRLPVWGGDAIEDRRMQCLDGWGGIGLEETVIDLVKYVSDGLCFVRQLDGEGRFEVRNELRYQNGLEFLDIGEREKYAHVL